MAEYVLLLDHEYIRDRGPYDDPLLITAWRWRWLCSCGSEGRWQTEGQRVAELGWRKHVKNLRERARGVPRSTIRRAGS